MGRHPVLLVIWIANYATFGIGVLVGLSGTNRDLAGFMIGLPFFAAMVIALVTYFRVKHDTGVLVHRRLYQVLVGSLLLSSTVTFVASGSTMMMSAKSPIGVVGLLTLGALNVLVAVLTWRALLQPTPRRAAHAGMIAVVFELFAMIPDILIDVHTRELQSVVMWTAIAVFAAMISMATGGLACIASMVAFGAPREQSLPSARVVE